MGSEGFFWSEHVSKASSHQARAFMIVHDTNPKLQARIPAFYNLSPPSNFYPYYNHRLLFYIIARFYPTARYVKYGHMFMLPVPYRTVYT